MNEWLNHSTHHGTAVLVTVARVEGASGLTNQGSRNLIHDAVRRGWVREVGTWGRGGKTYWVADAVLEIIDAPTQYDDHNEADGELHDPQLF